MEYILGILAVLGIGGFFALRGNPHLKKVLKFEKKESELKTKQEAKEEDIEDLNRRLKEVAEKAKKLDPKAIEDYWNDEDNS